MKLLRYDSNARHPNKIGFQLFDGPYHSVELWLPEDEPRTADGIVSVLQASLEQDRATRSPEAVTQFMRRH